MIEYLLPIIFVTEIFPKAVYTRKIKIRQKRLSHLIDTVNTPLNSIDDYLLAANNIAVKYFNDNTNLLKTLLQFKELDPKYNSYSTYTYAAYLSLTNKRGREDLHKDVRWVGGDYISKNIRRHHTFLEQKLDEKWVAFETIPDIRYFPAKYLSLFSFQLLKDQSIISSKNGIGFALLSIYGPLYS